jgi:1-acyl-sn-glycerol-3-phosphate acyltransferase
MKNATQKPGKPKRIGRPNFLLLTAARLVVGPYYRLRYGMKVDRSGLRDLKGPALVLAPHLSNFDHLVLGITLYPHRPTFVLSRHFTSIRALKPILRWMHVITKRMFSADISTILNVLRAKAEGNVIVLFPEGRLPACNGRSVGLTDGTAELVKKLEIPVYTVTGNGVALTFPKWAPKPHRGRIRVTTAKVLDAADVKALSADEIRTRLEEALTHDDLQAMAGVRYRAADRTAGLDGILYRCPSCNREGTLKTEKHTVTCPCGLSAALGEDNRLTGAPFDSIFDWYRWQEDAVDLSTPLCSEAVVGAIDGEDVLQDDAGYGSIRLTAEEFSFDGEVFGESLSFTLPTASITAFPITVGHHFDVYYRNRLLRFSPRPDPMGTVKWVNFLDKVTRTAKELV